MKRKPKTECNDCGELLEDCTCDECPDCGEDRDACDCNKCHNCGDYIDSDTSEGHPDFSQDMHCYECLKGAYEEKVGEVKAELKRIKDKLKLMRKKG